MKLFWWPRKAMKKTLFLRYKEFYNARKPYWKGTELDLAESILNDPDFLREVTIENKNSGD